MVCRVQLTAFRQAVGPQQLLIEFVEMQAHANIVLRPGVTFRQEPCISKPTIRTHV